jgi:hypothetical protein
LLNGSIKMDRLLAQLADGAPVRLPIGSAVKSVVLLVAGVVAFAVLVDPLFVPFAIAVSLFVFDRRQAGLAERKAGDSKDQTWWWPPS